MWGNAVALPVVTHVLGRIKTIDEELDNQIENIVPNSARFACLLVRCRATSPRGNGVDGVSYSRAPQIVGGSLREGRRLGGRSLG